MKTNSQELVNIVKDLINADQAIHRSSEEEHKADALALGAEEGRDKLRKAAVRSKYPATRRCPNGGTRLG